MLIFCLLFHLLTLNIHRNNQTLLKCWPKNINCFGFLLFFCPIEYMKHEFGSRASHKSYSIDRICSLFYDSRRFREFLETLENTVNRFDCCIFRFYSNIPESRRVHNVYLAQIVIENDCVSLFEIRIHFTKSHVKINHSTNSYVSKGEKKKQKLVITRLHLAVNDLMTPDFLVLLLSQAQTSCKTSLICYSKEFFLRT